jgi:hypothetical protein
MEEKHKRRLLRKKVMEKNIDIEKITEKKITTCF